jgi:DNA-cytosine methyltransferase
MNVLSLFDGISCGQIALNKVDIKYNTYYASEIDKHAIKVTQHNYPKTMQLGDVTKWKKWDIDWSKIDLLLAGSPCQGFSFAGKQLAFDDPRSALFFVFVDIWKHIKNQNPNAKYLLENVSMKQEHELIISKYMGVHPIEINSALLTAQNRVRLYWTNISNKPYGLFADMACTISQPKDKGILLKNVLESDVDKKYYLSDKMLEYFKNRAANFNQGKVNVREEEGKANCLTAGGNSGGLHSDMTLIVASRGTNPENPKSRIAGLETEQHLEPRFDGKTNCLTRVTKDNYVIGFDYRSDEGIRPRKDGKSPTLLARARQDIYGVGGVITHSTQPRQGKGQGGKGHLMKTDNKSYCVDNENSQAVEYNYNIRRLTPVECERLQTVPDNYTACVSDSQRYKMLGNGWTVDVICHILKFK